MWGIDVIHPITGVAARIHWLGHAYDQDGNVQMVRVNEFCVGLARYLGGCSHHKRLDVAIARARRMVGDYDCDGCGQPIHWHAEPERVYMHNDTDKPDCTAGGAARIKERN
jgi:hypothetical protein